MRNPVFVKIKEIMSGNRNAEIERRFRLAFDDITVLPVYNPFKRRLSIFSDISENVLFGKIQE